MNCLKAKSQSQSCQCVWISEFFSLGTTIHSICARVKLQLHILYFHYVPFKCRDKHKCTMWPALPCIIRILAVATIQLLSCISGPSNSLFTVNLIFILPLTELWVDCGFNVQHLMYACEQQDLHLSYLMAVNCCVSSWISKPVVFISVCWDLQ